ncbi:MAG TPA: methyltransferase [Myxococcota bacterium]|nr:methyltransferase [Myxococcota bacterium]
MNTASKKFFKGWAIPGPTVPGDDDTDLANCGAHETLDVLSGRFRIFQLRDGHRFSTDDVLTAWYGTSWAPCARRVLDLGSGIGSVGMTAAWRLPHARFVTIEAQEASVALARRSARYNGIADRFEIRQGDFRDLRSEERFDLILGSPPYFPLGAGTQSDHPQKVACRFEVRGTVADYCRTAAAHLDTGGLFACVFPVHPPHQRARVEAAAQAASLTIVRRRDVILREGEPPLLSLFAMTRAEDLPERMRTRTWVEPPLTIRCRDGKVHPEYAAVKLSFGFPP